MLRPIETNFVEAMIIEPCCFGKQLDELLLATEGEGRPNAAHFFTNGDVSLQELADYLIGKAGECDVFLSLVSVDNATVSFLDKLLQRTTARKSYQVRTLTLLSQGKNRKAIVSALDKYRHQGRLLMCEDNESFRCLAVGGASRHYVLQGSINQTVVYSMQLFTLTTSETLYRQVMEIFDSKKRTKAVRG